MRVLALFGSQQSSTEINRDIAHLVSGAADVEILVLSGTDSPLVTRVHMVSAGSSTSRDFEARIDDPHGLKRIVAAVHFAPDLCIGFGQSEVLRVAFPALPLLTLDKFNADLLQVTEEAARARNELAEIRASRSWKLTAPLRWIREPQRLKQHFTALSHKIWTSARDATRARPSLPSGRPRICLVSHDAFKHGAQYLALHLARAWKEQLDLTVDVVLLGEGPLTSDFQRVAHVHDLGGVDPLGAEATALARRLASNGVTAAVCNSAASGRFLATLTGAGIRCVSLVHELPGVIAQQNLHQHVELIRDNAAEIIFPTESVRDAFPGGRPARAAVLPQGLYKDVATAPRAAAAPKLRERLGLTPSTPIVLAVGYGDARKAPDLFVELARRTITQVPEAVFVWVGAFDVTVEPRIRDAIAAAELTDKVILAGFREDTDAFYAGADVFVLPSREDPYPTVILEALQAELPVAAFAGVGGFDALLARGCGVLSPAFDTASLANEISSLLKDEPRRARMGRAGSEIVRTEHSFSRYAYEVAARAGAIKHRVSVVVPNYNYARFLPARLQSIVAQTNPIYELIVLDDASTDDSVEVLRRVARELPVDCQIVVNERNAGSATRQWLAGVERARGDIVWIAEADDLSDPNFLATALQAFADPSIVLSYTQSLMMDEDGRTGGEDYLDYVKDIDLQRWRTAHNAAGNDEIRRILSIRNTIPNVSACLFRREVLLETLKRHIDEAAKYRIAGDWATYVRVLEHGNISFNPQRLNFHRRHGDGVTLSARGEEILGEILSMQAEVRARHDTSPEVQRLARAYAQRLYQQFGLDAVFPRVEQHPAFERYFDSAAAVDPT